ncbi:MAG: hypothetical protein HY554_14515 [Elusimicrobia bacterium]|nr:hypothetical protein [Elusimicrobiota bacterium]
MNGLELGRLPRSARWLVTLVLLSFALNHLFAFWLVWETTTNVDASAKEHFAYKTFAALLRMGHQHAFGHGTMYFITSALFLLTGLPERFTIPVITAAFLGAWLDLGSWFLLKYGSERWEWLSIASGTAYAAAFLIMLTATLWRAWRPRSDAP